MCSRNGKCGKWRVIYGAYGELKKTRPMSKREAKNYYSMARCNCMLGHWDWVEMIRVKKDFSKDRGQPLAINDLLRAANVSAPRQLPHLGKAAKTKTVATM